MAMFLRNQYGLRATSARATVPDNDVARLMYYLNCVFSAIEYTDQDVRRLRDYRNWSMLSYEEQRLVWLFALILSPDEFDDKVFFHSDALCGDSGNKFFEFSQVRHQLLAVQSIIIGGQTRQVKKIMTYKMSWIQSNYLDPMKRLAPHLSPQAQRPSTASAARPNYTPSNTTSNACVIS